MSYIGFLQKQETLKRMIKSEKTGTAEELAGRLSISRSTLFNYFDILKEQGLEVKFCRIRKTYCFGECDGVPGLE